MSNGERSWLIRVRDTLCCLYLIVFVIFEAYSAAATALDDTRRFPAWEAKLGWYLFALPVLLVIALVLFVRGRRGAVAFILVVSSVLLYLGFILLENTLAPEHMSRGDWVFTGIWIVLCTAAAAAGWLLKRTPKSEPKL